MAFFAGSKGIEMTQFFNGATVPAGTPVHHANAVGGPVASSGPLESQDNCHQAGMYGLIGEFKFQKPFATTKEALELRAQF